MTTPTPRTDAFADSCMTQTILIGKKREGEKANLAEVEWINAVELARQLERDLAAAQEELAAAKELIGPIPRSVVIDGLTTQLAAAQEALNQMGAAMREARQRAEAAERERDEANDKAVRVLRGEFAQICSYCGWESFDGNADAQPEAAWNALQSHIRKCAKHPLVQAEADRDEWKRKAEEAARDAARWKVCLDAEGVAVSIFNCDPASWRYPEGDQLVAAIDAIRTGADNAWSVPIHKCEPVHDESPPHDAAIAAKGEA